jgi:NADH pyrophosphatase NudC (nudix superfamily)
VYSAVPAVVAMQYQIEAGDASRFVGTFYRVLADGRSVGEAVSAGRRELAKGSEDTGVRQNWSTRLFGTPVVYLRQDVPLVSRPLPSPSRVSAPSADQQACGRCGQPIDAEARFCPRCGTPTAPKMRGGVGAFSDRWSVSGYQDVTA